MKKISMFCGDFSWLSNFHPSKITVDGSQFPSVEHAFQAFKTDNEEWFNKIKKAFTAGQAKRFGRQCPLKSNWDDIKIDVMKKCLWAKFSQNYELKNLLLNTGDVYLEEGNTWGDKFWGVVSGEGENNLGKLLMEVRQELRND